MLKKYFEHYSAYFKQLKTAESKPAESNMNMEVDSLQNNKPDTTKVEGEATPATK
jgi:hypothetical protein